MYLLLTVVPFTFCFGGIPLVFHKGSELDYGLVNFVDDKNPPSKRIFNIAIETPDSEDSLFVWLRIDGSLKGMYGHVVSDRELNFGTDAIRRIVVIVKGDLKVNSSALRDCINRIDKAVDAKRSLVVTIVLK